ncbi:hypothetical protein [Butyrivibrio sp. WCD2001]|nr:hypothetical protein [Butyrivibrio sp. WCD2001]
MFEKSEDIRNQLSGNNFEDTTFSVKEVRGIVNYFASELIEKICK